MNINGILDKVTDACCAGGTSSNTTAGTDGKDDIADDSKVVNGAATTPAAPATTTSNTVVFTDHETKYEFVSWSDLPSKAHTDAAIALGFDAIMWDGEEHHPEAWWKHWDHLSEAERKGAETLGWDDDAWEHKYENCDFEEIPEAVQRAAVFVGFDATMWNDDVWPEGTKHKSWDDLTDAEKRAYSVFGYTKPTWDH